MRRLSILFAIAAIAACSESPQDVSTTGDELALARAKGERIDAYFDAANVELARQGANYRLSGVWMFTLGNGRPSNRILQRGTRWVPGDPNRAAQSTGDEDVSYVVDVSDLTSDGGLTPAEVEQAIDDAFDTWSDVPNTFLDNIKFADDGMNHDFLDGVPTDPFTTCLVTPFQPPPLGIVDITALAPNADIITGGWLPREYFDCLVPDPTPGNGGGDFILGVTWTFVFVDGNGNPVDTNGDGYIDTALKEIYYNEAFEWVTSGAVFLGDDIDIESVVVHENGHAMDLGHFGGPPPPLKIHPNGRIFSPEAIMNPAYVGGELRVLQPTDIAGFKALFSHGVGRQN